MSFRLKIPRRSSAAQPIATPSSPRRPSAIPPLATPSSPRDDGPGAGGGRDADRLAARAPTPTLELTHVLYYKEHGATATPIRGTLRLGKHTLSFECPGYDYRWHLRSIARVEPFQGRLHSGLKVVGKRNLSAEEETLKAYGEMSRAAAASGAYQDKGEYTFTRVSAGSFAIIHGAVEEAKARASAKAARAKAKAEGKGKDRGRSRGKVGTAAEGEDEDEGRRGNFCAACCAAIAGWFVADGDADGDLTAPLVEENL